MFGFYDKRSLNLIILKILWEHTDAEHRLQQQEIVQLIKLEYGLEVDRRTVKNNVVSLKDLLFDTELEIDTENGYCLISRDFMDIELCMLIDSVRFSRHLTQKQSQELIEKLKRLSSRHFSKKVSPVCGLSDFQYTENKQQCLYNLEMINEAIKLGKKISFTYNIYGEDLKLTSKRKGYTYVVSPYQVILRNEYYYLICNFDRYSDIAHLRIDKMTQVEIMAENVKNRNQIPELGKGFNLSKHIAEHVYMYGGESVRATIKCSQSLIGELVDWFGKSFRIVDNKDGEIIIRVKCNEQSLFYWALQYGTCAEVIEPVELRCRIREAVERMSRKYAK